MYGKSVIYAKDRQLRATSREKGGFQIRRIGHIRQGGLDRRGVTYGKFVIYGWLSCMDGRTHSRAGSALQTPPWNANKANG